MTQQNQKNQRRKPRTDHFRWDKYFPGGFRLYGDSRAELSSMNCSVRPREEELKRIRTKADPRPNVVFRFIDLLHLLKHGTFKGSVKRGLINGKRDGDYIQLYIAPTSLQREKEVSQSDLLERTVRWTIHVKAVEEAKMFAKLLYEFNRKVQALNEELAAPKATSTGILRPMENAKQAVKPNGQHGKNHSVRKANPSTQKVTPPAPPREKQAGGMGTLGNIAGAALDAPKAMSRKQAAKFEDEPRVEAPKPTPEDRIAELQQGDAQDRDLGLSDEKRLWRHQNRKEEIAAIQAKAKSHSTDDVAIEAKPEPAVADAETREEKVEESEQSTFTSKQVKFFARDLARLTDDDKRAKYLSFISSEANRIAVLTAEYEMKANAKLNEQ